MYFRALFNYKPPGAYIWRGDLTEGFLRYEFEWFIFEGAYSGTFTVFCPAKVCTELRTTPNTE